jgi:hypothetical protein
VALAEVLVASGFSGPATIEVAALSLPINFFEGPFYVQIPAWDDQGPLDRVWDSWTRGTT